MWNDAVSKSPNKVRPYANRTAAYTMINRCNKTLVDYANVIEIDSLSSIAYYNRGYACNKLKLWNDAIADYTKALNLDSVCTDAYYNRGIAYGNTGQFNKSSIDFSKAIEIDPKLRVFITGRHIWKP
ncbi:MAG: tetratricopeptide repeat protein [Bacteroidales bacterium]|nr:tetratricopeptide repeat protein [Bacteroidales bacterium]